MCICIGHAADRCHETWPADAIVRHVNGHTRVKAHLIWADRAQVAACAVFTPQSAGLFLAACHPALQPLAAAQATRGSVKPVLEARVIGRVEDDQTAQSVGAQMLIQNGVRTQRNVPVHNAKLKAR